MEKSDLVYSKTINEHVSIKVDFRFLIDLKRAIDIVFYSTKYEDLRKLLGEKDYDNFLWFNEIVSEMLHDHYKKEGFDINTGKIDIGSYDEFCKVIEINQAIVKAMGIMGTYFETMALDKLYSFSVTILTKWVLKVYKIHNEWSMLISNQLSNQAA